MNTYVLCICLFACVHVFVCVLRPVAWLPGSTQQRVCMCVSVCVCVCACAETCCVVSRQYSAVLRMLQMRHSSSTVNFAASEPSFSFSRLLMVSPTLLLLVLCGKRGAERESMSEKRGKALV